MKETEIVVGYCFVKHKNLATDGYERNRGIKLERNNKGKNDDNKS